jgi:uncharacterized membrane protein
MTPEIPDVGGFMDAVLMTTVITIIASLASPLIIIGVIIWAIRRNAPARRDPAEESLRARLARGEIDQSEFLVRMRALHDGDDRDIT